MRQAIIGAWLALLSTSACAVTIDGRIDPGEWRGAQHVTDFRQVQPLSGKPGSLATEAWILATPEGLAVAFRAAQPSGVRRTHQRVQRDFEDQVDRVNVMVDFDGDGRSGYNFTLSSTDGVFDAVISNETTFSKDWDGIWRHAVSEDEAGWSAEILIPWYTAPMHEGRDGKRTIGIYLDRVIGATGERMAWPWASFERPRFLSDFARIEVPQYGQALLAVTPYVSALYDNVRGRSRFDGGADVFWKPNGQFQMTATLNPDFGQVESDDLVVNFDAVETYFSDKRPFFTENQGLFQYTTPEDNSQLLYTRRIGGPADDGNGAGDITAAVKVNGSLGATKYGLFHADEADAVGRSFSALRLVRDFDTQNLGLMMTHVDRPWLDREATVLGIDHNWRPNTAWNVQSRVFGSDVRQQGKSTRGLGATVWADYDMGGGWRQQWIGMHFGNSLQINDAGYLDRNSINYAHWELQRRFTDLPPASRYASTDWHWRVVGLHNDHGDRLAYQFRVQRNGQLRDGGGESIRLDVASAGVDDTLTRGNGNVWTRPSFRLSYDYTRPRHGRWSHEIEARAMSGGLAGNRKVGYLLRVQPVFFFSDALSAYAGLSTQRIPDWLVWQRDTLVGSFDQRMLELDAGLNWNVGNRHELRAKLQAIGLDAPLRQAWRVQPGGGVVATPEPVDGMHVRNLGFQIRYRYELAPLSYLYVVYARGGYEQDADMAGTGDALHGSFRLRDDEQLLVKLNYRFEL